MEPVQQQRILHIFHAGTEAIFEGLYTSKAASADTHWTILSALCANVALKPLIMSYKDPIPFLATFAVEYRCGNISASGKNLFSCILEDAVLSIGQALAAMGDKDPWLNSEGALEICLKFQYRTYFNQDPPTNCVKPVPVQVLRHISSITAASTNEDLKAIPDIIHIAYLFLLCPGEYTGTKSSTNPFQINDVSLSCGAANFDIFQTPADALKNSTYGKM